MSAPTQGAMHLHLDDYPHTLTLLADVVAGRRRDGYQPDEHGAWVDWVLLTAGGWSSSERAVLHIARGCQVLEAHGGTSPALRQTTIDTVTAVA